MHNHMLEFRGYSKPLEALKSHEKLTCPIEQQAQRLRLPHVLLHVAEELLLWAQDTARTAYSVPADPGACRELEMLHGLVEWRRPYSYMLIEALEHLFLKEDVGNT